MKFYTKLIITLFQIFICSTKVHSQLNVAEVVSFELGGLFKNTKSEITSKFTGKPVIMKSDFYGAYRIEYEKTPFDFYGDGDYTFQFVKDSLVSIKVQFEFLAKDTLEARRLLSTLLVDFKSNPNFKINASNSTINLKEFSNYISKECITNTENENPKYKPIKKKFLGQNFWRIYKNDLETDKYICIYIDLGETHRTSSENGVSTKYDGCYIHIVFEMTSIGLENLKIKEEQFDTRNYRLINM